MLRPSSKFITLKWILYLDALMKLLIEILISYSFPIIKSLFWLTVMLDLKITFSMIWLGSADGFEKLNIKQYTDKN